MAVSTLAAAPIMAADNELTAAEKAEGYQLLFDGSTFNSFKLNFVDYVKGDSTNTTLNQDKWRVNTTDHTIALPSGSATDIRSIKKYKDFELRWTYRIDGNQGVFYRALLKYDRAWLTGIEYAINDVTNLGKDNPGAAYDLYAPPTPVPYNTFSTAKWNTARIVVKGDSVEHWSNGVKVVGFKYHSPSFWTTYNTSKWVNEGPRTLTNTVPGRQDVGTGFITEGYIGLQGDHGGRWQIKDLKLTESPCFGAIKADGSVCPSSPISVDGNKAFKLDYSIHAGTRGVFVGINGDAVKAAQIVGLDGKRVATAAMIENGRKAEFSGMFKTGVYILKLDMGSGVVSRKFNVL